MNKIQRTFVLRQAFAQRKRRWRRRNLLWLHPSLHSGGEKGVSIFLAVIILTVILGVALGISTISVFQTKMIKGMIDSVTSFYAADTGMELILYRDKRCRLVGCDSLPWVCLDVLDCDEGLPAGSVLGNIGSAAYRVNFNAGANSVSSEGTYQGTKRAVRVQR